VLRESLENTPETVQELELAAEARYWEGLELMALGRRDVGIYLMGYGAEMHLKLACFRLVGASNVDPVEALRNQARLDVRAWPVAARPPEEGLHSLRFWFALLKRRRQDAGRSDLTVDFERCVERLYQTWWVGMRYHQGMARDADMDQVFEDVSWLARNYSILWS